MWLRRFEVATNFRYSLTRINCRFLILIKRFQPLSNEFLNLGRNGNLGLFIGCFHSPSVSPDVISTVDRCKMAANLG
jgi:hypothetical protein